MSWVGILSLPMGLVCLSPEGNHSLQGPNGSIPLTPHISKRNSPSPTSSVSSSVVTSPCLLVQSATRSPVPVSLKSSLCKAGRSEVLVSCHVPKSSREQLGMIFPLQEASDLSASIFAAYTVCQADSRNVVVRLMNTSNVDIQLQAGQKISEFCPHVEIVPSSENTRNANASLLGGTAISQSDIHHQLSSAISPSVAGPDRDIILQRLLEFSDVFEDSLGHTNVVTHSINTGMLPLSVNTQEGFPMPTEMKLDIRLMRC